MADFRNVTMFIVQVLNSVLAILCEAKPALTCMAAKAIKIPTKHTETTSTVC